MNRRPQLSSLGSQYNHSNGVSNVSKISSMRSASGSISLRRSIDNLGSSQSRNINNNNNKNSLNSPVNKSPVKYHNNNGDVSAALSVGTGPPASSLSVNSPSRYNKRRGNSTNNINRPGSSVTNLASLLPPHNNSFSMSYEIKVMMSSGKSSNKPIQLCVGIAGLQGFRPTMEDGHLSLINGTQVENQQVSLFAIFDGHCGRRVADYGVKLLPENLFSHPLLGKNNALALVESIVQTDRLIFQNMGKNEGGSTLICALVYNRMLFVACLGDARAVLYEGSETIAMSEDHKPNDPKENQRISRCGGMVQLGRVCGCLAVSRALGDFEFKFNGTKFIPNKELMVSNIADIRQINITDSTHFLILACDGLWDVLTNEEATSFVVDYLSKYIIIRDHQNATHSSAPRDGTNGDLQRALELCAAKLADFAIEKGSMDNVSVLIIAFHNDLISDFQNGKQPLGSSLSHQRQAINGEYFNRNSSNSLFGSQNVRSNFPNNNISSTNYTSCNQNSINRSSVNNSSVFGYNLRRY